MITRYGFKCQVCGLAYDLGEDLVNLHYYGTVVRAVADCPCCSFTNASIWQHKVVGSEEDPEQPIE